MRIGYLVPQFPGQTHIFFWREIRALEEMGHEVHLLSTRKPPQGLISHRWSAEAMARTTYLGAVAPLQAAGGLARLLPRGLPVWMAREGLDFTKDAILTLSAAQALLTLSRVRRLDHVHAHSCGRAALIAAFAERMGGPRYSLTLHGALQDYGPGQRFKWRHAAFATVITQTLRNTLSRDLGGYLPDRLPVQAMGVDTDDLRPAGPYQPVQHGEPMRLFSCGRLNVFKGHQDLMSAVRQLLDDGVDVRLEIAGEDDVGGTGYRKELETHLRKLRLQDHVRLLGAVDADIVRDKLQQAHLFVLASWNEPLGVAYMEAMACGVPTIGTNAGGVHELIEDGVTGRLVAPKAPRELARLIRDLAQSPETCRAFSTAGRAHVVANFSAAGGAACLVREIRHAMGTAP
ncbi:glycosyltransferase family 4 protein [Thalassococcus sp. CAU 1522]|uniref:Glycosyltransferase family 4 protein n=1 Tax=Thalassococcus arenae TaxID=2851652 RepID=A0ABS6N6A2_9RHOB|nr:exopolysaccharide biosynthesis GT4 family glycosyltransferase EpsE [Thalassococcus arenae]MBV2359541.1 glycosyltransferase family 4 protein [Thalassococcus arenae]